MSSETITVCDGGCGRTENTQKPKGWFKIVINSNNSGGTASNVDVCSWLCLGNYGRRRHQEQVAKTGEVEPVKT